MIWFLARKLRIMGKRADPRPAFARAMRADLIVKGYLPRHPSLRRWMVRHAAAASIILTTMAVGATGAYAYSSDEVLPDHPLYPVRQTLERIEERVVAPAPPHFKERVLAQLARRRTHEVQMMVAKHRPLKPHEVHFLRSHPDIRARLLITLDATTTTSSTQQEAIVPDDRDKDHRAVRRDNHATSTQQEKGFDKKMRKPSSWLRRLLRHRSD